MNQLLDIYNQFLSFFPSNLHGIISIVLGILLIVAVFKVITKQFIYIILLIILLPASIPIFKNIWESIATAVKFLLSR
jgi:hypothetical protein